MNTSVEDILGMDLGAVETTRPVLVKGTVPATITDMKLVEMKDPSKGSNLMVTYKITTSVPTIDGGKVDPGFTITQRVALLLNPQTDGELKSAEISAQTRARIREACGYEKAGSFTPFEQYIGKDVMIGISVRKAEGAYPESNDVGGPYKLR